MKYLLDTNVCIKYLNGLSENILNRLSECSPEDIVLCSVVKSELYAGAYKSSSYLKVYEKLKTFFNVFESLPFDDKSADVYGKIRSNLEKEGSPIGPYDMQIASIALANNLILVTHNIDEFSRVKNLKIEDWE